MRGSFGYHRFEILAAALDAVLLFAAAAHIVIKAWQRLREPTPIQSGHMLGIAGLGLAVNLIGMGLLREEQAHNLNCEAPT